jgi:phage shock protein C
MKYLHNSFDMTREAVSVAGNFFKSLRGEGERLRANPAEVAELSESLEEHLSIALRQELDRRKMTRVDAQLMVELLLLLGTPEELMAELPRATLPDGQIASSSSPSSVPSSSSLSTIGLGSVHADGSGSPTGYVAELAGAGSNPGQVQTLTHPDWRTRFWRKPLCRSRNNRWVLGVCGGFADFFGVSGLLIRFLFVFSGVGVIAYFLLGLALPNEDELIPGQTSASFSGCLVRGLEWVFRFFMLVCVYFPIAAAMLLLAGMGGQKILFELGISGLPSGDSWSYFVMGFPGLISGLCNLVLGFSFVAITLHFALATMVGHALLAMNTRKVLAFLILFAVFMQSGLWGLAKSQNRSQFRETEVFSFPAQDVQELYLNAQEGSFPLHQMSIEVVGEENTASITVEIVREASGQNEGSAGEALRQINASPNLQGNRLQLPAGLPRPPWWFYHYPELKMTVRVPRTHPLKFNTQGKIWHGRIRFRHLQGVIDLKSQMLGLVLEGISGPSLSAKTAMGSIELKDIQVGSLTLQADMGSIEARDLSCGDGHVNSHMGSIEFSRVQGTFDMETNMGSIEVERFSGPQLNLHTNAGSIEFSCDPLPARAEIRAVTNMGSIKATFPRHPVPHLILSTKMGGIHNVFAGEPQEAEGPKVELKTSMGGIHVRRSHGGSVPNTSVPEVPSLRPVTASESRVFPASSAEVLPLAK